MKYQFNKVVKQKISLAAGIATVAFAFVLGVGGLNAGTAPKSSAAGGGTVDSSICNTPDAIANFSQVMWAGTVKSKVNPEFVVTGANLCAVQFNARFVATTTAYTYDFATRQYVLSDLPGYPRVETTKAMAIKPGAMSVRFKLNEFPVPEVIQMYTVVNMYHVNSFNADGTLKADARPLATDDSRWTQTNFVTF